MSQSELPLYPKLSPIYNKIMQLAIAIVLIIILLNILVFSHRHNKEKIMLHFEDVSREISTQTAQALSLLISQSDKQITEQYVATFLATSAVSSLHYYDETGLLVASSAKAKNINDLYGITEHKLAVNHRYIPFVEELYANDKLKGYVRLTIDKDAISSSLLTANDKTNELYRIMLVLAGLVGFLLTRGLNRFSRQGFRLAK